MDVGPDRNTVKTQTLQKIREQRVALGPFLEGRVILKSAQGTRDRNPRSLKLSSIGEAWIEYIHDNPNDTSMFEFADPEALVLGEVDAIMEYLEGRASLGGGGALFQSLPPKMWAMDSPSHTPTTQGQIDANRNTLPNWAPVTSVPAHGGTSAPQVSTPGGTTLEHYATYKLMSPGGTEHRLHMYGQDANPFKPSLDPSLGSSGKGAYTGKLGTYLFNMKRAESQVIDKALLNRWAGKRKGFKPDQNTAMSGTSAKLAAKERLGGEAEGKDWQWLHLIAFTLGGDTGDPSNPNTVANLVAGTAASNGHHLVIENLVKRLILSGAADSIKIAATAHMISGSRHVATKIEYAIEATVHGSTKKYGFFEIDTLSGNLSAGGDLGALAARFF